MVSDQPGPIPNATVIADAVRSGRLTARAAVEHSLARIARHDPALNAFTVVRADQARAEADAQDAGGRGHHGPLAGVPVAVKEEYDVAGLVTTLGGRGNSTPAASDSDVIKRLRDAGAIIVGKTAMPEFGQFPHTEGLDRGRTHNPWALDRSPGGSSGGSAVAVASGMVPIALGADGGGSIRIPASACGLVGLKPQRGRITPSPLIEHWFGLVVLGALTRSVADQALVLDAIAGSLPADRYRAAPLKEPLTSAITGRPRLRVGWTIKPVMPGAKVDPEVSDAMAAFGSRLAELGHAASPIEPRWPVPTPAFLPQFFAGMRVEAGQVEHPERLEPRTRATVAMSGWATPRVVEAALAAGRRVTAALDALLADWDVIAVPTMTVPPPKLGLLDGLGAVRSLLKSTPIVGNTAIFNVSGHPALSIPMGLTSDGLPLGVQLLGPYGGEGRLIALAAELEEAQPWDAVAPAYR